GSFNTTTHTYVKQNFITDSWIEASHYFLQAGGNADISVITEYIDKKIDKYKRIYRVQTRENCIKYSDNRVVYKAVVDRGNLETYRILKYIKSYGNQYKILKIRTDCVYYA